MPPNPNYTEKFEQIADQTLYRRLNVRQQTTLRRLAHRYRFTLQELRQVSEIALDLEMWGEPGLHLHWPGEQSDRPDKKQLIKWLNTHWEQLKATPNRYSIPPGGPAEKATSEVLVREKGQLGLGHCPVASARTRCCNLMTLDAVENCGYRCSYCSIQSFYRGNEVFFDPGFGLKLQALELDPDRIYHIGTGQSSDSLMWGNSHGVLDSLIDFAEKHPNVILELKTKSANINHLLQRGFPGNLICTWSLNPQTIIDHEEQGSASLEKRLDSALGIAETGGLVGFHFHPMIHYHGWERDYGRLFARVQEMFNPEQVVMISLGTLTFIKPVIRQIRESGIRSQILKHQLVEADGKLSYPQELKRSMFSFAYNCFTEIWKRSVFFYLCMENQRLWKPVFGFDYPSNEKFEQAMKRSYMAKVSQPTGPQP